MGEQKGKDMGVRLLDSTAGDIIKFIAAGLGVYALSFILVFLAFSYALGGWVL